MKKFILIAVIFCVIALGFTYLFIPNYISLKAAARVNITENAARRELVEITSLGRWWPEAGKNDSVFIYKDFRYRVIDKNYSGLVLNIENGSKKIKSLLSIIPFEKDSVTMNWESTMASSWNPITRWKYYLLSRQLKHSMQELLNAMQAYYNDTGHLYGISIRREKVKDSTLISTSSISHGYPGMQFVYNLIDKLKKYAASQSARETDFPMLNIYTTDSVEYTVKVALPLDKILPSTSDIAYKWMLGGGNILVADIRGGNNTLQMAQMRLEQYVADYKLIAPAIPFQSLVTNRLQETDSSKWVTRIYYPVM